MEIFDVGDKVTIKIQNTDWLDAIISRSDKESPCDEESPCVPIWRPCRILKSGDRTIVFWPDGEKTIVKRAADEPDNDYAAFTAALGIKLFGSNSALKRMIERKTVQQKPKEKKKDTAVPDIDSQTKLAEKVFRAFGEAVGRGIRKALNGGEPKSDQPTKSSAE